VPGKKSDALIRLRTESDSAVLILDYRLDNNDAPVQAGEGASGQFAAAKPNYFLLAERRHQRKQDLLKSYSHQGSWNWRVDFN
jgi:hypothetical protein